MTEDDMRELEQYRELGKLDEVQQAFDVTVKMDRWLREGTYKPRLHKVLFKYADDAAAYTGNTEMQEEVEQALEDSFKDVVGLE